MQIWPLLLALLAGLALGLDSSRQNPWATDATLADAGRGVLASQTLDYGEVVACFFEALDTRSDQELTVGEVQRGLGTHMSWTEQFHSGLSVEALFANCDANGDGVITYVEMEGTNGHQCLTTNQQESIARYVCSRKKHKDLSAASYRASYDVWRQAFHDGTLIESLRSESAKVSDVIQPHAGRLVGARVAAPTSQDRKRIGSSVNSQLILFLAVLYLIVVLIVLFVVYVLPTVIDLVGLAFF